MKFPEEFRVQFPPRYVSRRGDGFGAFIVPAHKAPGRRTLRIIATDGKDESGWEHVSVSIDNAGKQIPTWEEMCFIKALFWDGSQCVVQFHPAVVDYVNHHKGTLHLWRPLNQAMPTPPKICV